MNTIKVHKQDVRAVVIASKMVGKPRKGFTSKHKPVKGKNGVEHPKRYDGRFRRAEVNEIAGRVVNSTGSVGLTDEQVAHCAKLVQTTLINRVDKR